MKRKFGLFFVVLGLLLMLAAAVLLAYNQKESQNALQTSQTALAALQAETKQRENQEDSDPYLDRIDPYDPVAAEMAADMTEVEIDGELYIGYLTVPVLELELPVISEWSYESLKIAPCRQYGATKTDDLVIAAHNYASHFGRLSQLRAGDLLTFTDMDAEVVLYSVEVVDVLDPAAVDTVKNSDFDLVLYTCTYGGESRVVVFCNRIEL